MEEIKTACVTGHRPDKLWGYNMQDRHYNILREQIYISIIDLMYAGVEEFWSGGALGIDQIFFEEVQRIKRYYPLIINNIAIPFKGFDALWQPNQQKHFKELCQQADKVFEVCEKGYKPWKMYRRNEFMVDKSDFVIAVWNGEEKGGTWNCVDYAVRQQKPIIRINPLEL